MAKSDTLFMTKTAETIPFGAAHTYIAHKKGVPPPPGFYIKFSKIKTFLIVSQPEECS